LASIAITLRRERRRWSVTRRRNFVLHLVLPLTVSTSAAVGMLTAVATGGGAPVADAAPRGTPSAAAIGPGDALEASGPPAKAPQVAAARVLRPLPQARRDPPIHWRHSRAVGQPWSGSLVNGVQLPPYGRDFVSWDAVLHRSPDRAFRRFGTDRLLRTVLAVARAYRRAHPGAPRLVIQDMSLQHGGFFGAEWGGLGHQSHQNGLDVDIAYPRRDGREIGIDDVSQIAPRFAQELVDRFVRAGAQYVFVGYHTHLHGPSGVVMAIPYHDDHMHVRIFPS
jgi:penicillin-insensitive murein endopeptidase